MVICGCPPINEIQQPKQIVELCPKPKPIEPIIKLETKTETINKNCFNNLAIGFSFRRACGGMDCGE